MLKITAALFCARSAFVFLPDDSRHVQYQDFLNACHPKLGTFIHEAAKHDKKDVVRALLNEGADPGILDENQDTAVDLISSVEMRQVFTDVLIQSAAGGK